MPRLDTTRRGFGFGLLGATLPGTAAAQTAMLASGPAPDESHLGNLYPFVQQQADSSPVALSFLRPDFRSLQKWQPRARKRVLDSLMYAPGKVPATADVVRRTDRGDYTVEHIWLQTAPEVRVPAFVLIPKTAKLPAPGIVALHDHGGFYFWGKEK